MKRLFRILFLSLILTGFFYSIYYLFGLFSDSSNEEFFIEKKDNIEFGFNLDNYRIDRDTIQFGDSFGEIMLRNKLSYSQIYNICLLYTSPSPRDRLLSRMPSSA